MTGLDEETLERLRTDGDQPAPMFHTGKVCAYLPCSKPLVPRESEQPWHFARRIHCDASCANRRVQGSTAPLDLPTEKPCDECGETTRRRVGESPGRWAARRFCSKVCASRNTIRRNQPVPLIAVVEEKVCAACGCTMPRRVGERSNRWMAREACSRSCASKLKALRAGKQVPAKPKTVRKNTPKPAPPPVPEPVPTPAAPAPAGLVWRPSGWSKTPNAWAGHRPPEPDPIEAAS